jgi:hypothetical protein
MGFNTEIKRLLKNQRLCMILAAVVFLGVVVSLYNVHKATDTSSMHNEHSQENSEDQYSGETAPSAPHAPPVDPAMPMGLNSGPGSVTGIQTVTGGVPQSCLKQQVANPSQLLPKDHHNDFAAAHPSGGGDLQNISLLKAGQLSGIDTVGGTLRNANLQLRSEPPNPRAQVSPWSNSTIEPDLMRVPLELGCGPQ